MNSPCLTEAKESCFHGCFPQSQLPTSIITTTVSSSRYDFELAMLSSISPNSNKFTNHESLPSLHESFSNFTNTFPQFSLTDYSDKIRQQEYYHLTVSNNVCLDYIGHSLFSYSQSQQKNHSSQASMVASTSASPPPVFDFDIAYKSVNLTSQLQDGGLESESEKKIKKRIMEFMNISEDDYTMIFTANQSSAFKIVSDIYPFQSYKNILTVYDYENESVKLMIESCKRKGVQVNSAEFQWPTLRILSGKLQKKIEIRRKKGKKKGLFIFPLQSRITGGRYSYLWMRIAEENGWHVLIDASALSAKEMETLGLLIFKPDFLICSFFKVFGENPSGFACLFVKKSSISEVLKPSSMATGAVKLIPATAISQSFEDSESESLQFNQELEFRGLDHADELGLILISARARYLINWLINALMSLEHPHSETGHPPIKIYGPKIKFGRGPAVAFNVFDWKGERINPEIVQKLGDRNNISMSCGFLQNIWIADEEERGKVLETRTSTGGNKCYGVSVVTVAIGFLTNFEDVYRLWSFISRFLDADFVEKERWRYIALNQNIVEI